MGKLVSFAYRSIDRLKFIYFIYGVGLLCSADFGCGAQF
jgi:hypothetical protein